MEGRLTLKYAVFPLAQGFFSELLVQKEAVGLPVSMHLFEYTARWALVGGWVLVWDAGKVGRRLTLGLWWGCSACLFSSSGTASPSPSQLLPALHCRYKKHAGLDCYPPLQIVFATKTTNRSVKKGFFLLQHCAPATPTNPVSTT